MPSNDVFISYRRSASQNDAYSVYQGLDRRGINVFFDYLSIDEDDWQSVILRQIAARPYFILMVAPGTLNRCKDKKDILRREIEEAVRLDRHIFLIYTSNFKWSDLDRYLPSPIAGVLKAKQGIKLMPDPNFKESTYNELRDRYLKPVDNVSVIDIPESDKARVQENQNKVESIIPKEQRSTSCSAVLGFTLFIAMLAILIIGGLFLSRILGNSPSMTPTSTIISSPTAIPSPSQARTLTPTATDVPDTPIPTPNPTITAYSTETANPFNYLSAFPEATQTKIAELAQTSIAKGTSVALDTQLKSLHGHTDIVRSVAVSRDGKYIVSVSYDGTVRIWDVASGEQIGVVLRQSAALLSVAYSPDGRLFAVGGENGMIWVWGATSYILLNSYSGQSGKIFSIAFSGDGDLIASGSSDNTIHVWRPLTNEVIFSRAPEAGNINGVAFSPTDPFVVSAADDGTLQLWGIKSGRSVTTFSKHLNSALAVAYSPNGRFIASGSVDTYVRIWDVQTGENLKVFRGHSGNVWSVAYSKDGNWIVSGGSDGTILVRNASTGEIVNALRGLPYTIYSVAFSPDQQRIIFGGSDNDVHIWTLPPL